MKKQAKESDKLGVSGGITVGTILVLAAVGLVAVISYAGQFVYNYQKEKAHEEVFGNQNTEVREEIQVHANNYQYIQFHDGTIDWTNSTIIDFLNITKNGEVTKKDGTVLTQYIVDGVSLEDGKVYKHAKPMNYWLTQEEFNKIFLPLGKGPEMADFLCYKDGDPVHGKVLMTIENSQQRDVYIVEKDDGTLAYMGIHCEIVTNYKKL